MTNVGQDDDARTEARFDFSSGTAGRADSDGYFMEQTASRGDASRATIDAPAHPLPAQRQGRIDYDQYLESQTSNFKIFSAEEDRKRRRSTLLITAGVIVTMVVLWAIISRL